MKPVYVICPANAVTGGPEVLHQLVRAIRDADHPAFIVYHPFDRVHQTPSAYAKYEAPIARRADIPVGAEVILPEMWPGLIPQFAECHVNFWWLSVDNFRQLLLSRRARRLLRSAVSSWVESILAARAMRHVRKADRHLYQSEYARLFLQDEGLAPAERLCDYINDDYLGFIGTPPKVPREDIIAYNPAKGRERTQAVLRALSASAGHWIKPVPIINMTRTQVQDLLARAKIYIDFGHHPGKDRIPREAAAMGACVLVNRRGSAANPIDVHVPDFFRVDDRQHGFAAVAAEKIIAITDSFEHHQTQFDVYRRRIAAEPLEFKEDARRIFAG